MMVETQQDAVGLLCLGRQIEEHIPARQGKNQLRLIYQHLANPPGGGGGRFGDLRPRSQRPHGQRAAWCSCSPTPRRSRSACSRRSRTCAVREQDVTLIQVLDRNEVDFPFDRMTEFRHPETGPADRRRSGRAAGQVSGAAASPSG